MSEKIEVSNGFLRVVISKKILGYSVDIYEKGDIIHRLKCVKSKGKSVGVYLYTPINSMCIGAIADFTIQRELVISISNRPEITIKY